MTEPAEAPRRRRRNQPEPPPPAGSVARGLALVVVAFLVGVILLRDDDGLGNIGQIGSSTVTSPGGDLGDGGDDDETTASTVVSTTIPVRSASEVEVLVANGSGVTGAAASVTDQVTALGYLPGTPTNAQGRVPFTTIYYVLGYDAEASRLAVELSPTTPPTVAPMPTPAPVDELAGAHLLVVLGPDLAPAAG